MTINFDFVFGICIPKDFRKILNKKREKKKAKLKFYKLVFFQECSKMLKISHQLFRNLIRTNYSSYYLNKYYTAELTNDQHKYVSNLFDGVVGNKRADLAKAITLIETTSSVKKKLSQQLLNSVLLKLKKNRENNEKICLRVG